MDVQLEIAKLNQELEQINDVKQKILKKKKALQESLPADSTSIQVAFFEKKFHKRSGTTNKGIHYEQHNIAHLVLKLVEDNRIEKFSISSNDDNFGVFDDIVVDLQESQKCAQRLAIQLKHGDRELTLANLKEENGDFGLKKYFESFRTTKYGCRLFLMTNRKFNKDPTKSKITLDVGTETIQVEMTKCYEDVLRHVTTKKDCYKFNVVKDSAAINLSSIQQEYSDFFKSFYLCTKQANHEQLNREIVKHFGKFLGNGDQNRTVEVAEKYISFISKWCSVDGDKEKLNKKIMKRLIALLLVDKFINEITFDSKTENVRYLRNAVSKFDVTIFKPESIVNVKKIWCDCKTDLESIDINKINRVRKRYQIKKEYVKNIDDLNDMERTKLLWLMNKCPLIVTENQCLFKVIRFCTDRKFVFIGDGPSEKSVQNCRIFRRLCDIEDSGDKDDLEKKVICRLPGEEVNIESLVRGHRIFSNIITTDVLLEIIDCPDRINKHLEDLPPDYMNRFLPRNLINKSCLEIAEANTLMFISNFHDDDVHLYSENFKLIFLDGSFKLENTGVEKNLDEENSLPTLYVCKNECSLQHIVDICNREGKLRRYYHFMMNNGKLEWIRTNTNIFDLERHVATEDEDFIEETLLTSNFSTSINVVADDPGMGKTLLLKNLHNRFCKKHVSIILFPKDIVTICSRLGKSDKDHFEDFLLQEKFSSYNEFDKYLLKLQMQRGKVIYLWDGLDEVSEDNLHTISSFILQLSEKVLTQWVTCRTHLKNHLERKFNVFSRKIVQLDEKQQVQYIQNRLELNKFTKEDRDKLFERIKHRKILGVPLHLSMLVELLEENSKTCTNLSSLLHKIYNSASLYEHFVDSKFNYFNKAKADINSTNNYMQEMVAKNTKKSTIDNYQKAAVQVFDAHLFLQLKLDCGSFLNDVLRDGDPFGFITKVTEGQAQFLHSSFAEYFVALYFLQHYQNIPDLKHTIFEPKYTMVRLFFDMKFAENSPQHVAVLNQNLDDLRECVDKLTTVDKAGRNLLQVACSHGPRYPPLEVKCKNNIYFIDDNLVHESEEEKKHVDILKYLLSKREIDLDQNGDIFGMNCFLYAKKSDNFLAIATIEQICNADYLSFVDDAFLCSLLYYFSKSAEYDSVEFLQNSRRCQKMKKNTWLHFACQNGNKNLVRLLIQFGAQVNAVDDNGWTPLYLALLHEHHELCDLLTENGVDIGEVVGEDGDTLLHLASRSGHDNVIEALMKTKKVNVNACNKHKVTPLHFACLNGHGKTVDLLIKSYQAEVYLADEDGWTPIALAVSKGHEEIFKALYEECKDINEINRRNGGKLLHLSLHNGQKAIAKLLIKLGIDVNIADKNKLTPLYLALQFDYKNEVNLLLEHRADVSALDENNNTLLHIAIDNDHENVARSLIDLGISLNCKNEHGSTPLHEACRRSQKNVVGMLVSKEGTDLNVQDNAGCTSLHISADNGDVDVCNLLIAAGAELNLSNKLGWTPVCLALLQNYKTCTEALSQAGADVNKAKNGDSLLDVAIKHDNLPVVNQLLDMGADPQLVSEANRPKIDIITSRREIETDKTFKKRTGMVDVGEDFEQLYIAHLVLRLIVDDNVRNFHLSSGDECFGIFNDVIIEIEDEHGMEAFAIQLRHISRNKNLRIQNLESEKGNFAIGRYAAEYQKIRPQKRPVKVVLFTNGSFYIPNDKAPCAFGNIKRCEQNVLITTSELHGRCYVFEANEANRDKYGDFFQYFSLYTDQLGFVELQKCVFDIFGRYFGHEESACHEYVRFIKQWSRIESSNFKLDKKWMKQVIALCVFSPFIKTLSFTSGGSVCDKGKMFREAISKSRLTVLDENKFDRTKLLWSDSVDILNDVVGARKVNKKYGITESTIKTKECLYDIGNLKLSKLIWLLGKSPLVVKSFPQVYQTIKICQVSNLILLDDRDNFNLHFQTTADELNYITSADERVLFQKLSQLKNDPQLFEIIKDNFTYSLEGQKEVSLRHLLETCKDVDDLIYTDDIVDMLEAPLCVGNPRELLPTIYIERKVTKILVDIEFLKNLEQNIVVLVACVADITVIKQVSSNLIIDRIDDVESIQYPIQQKVYIFQNDVTSEQFRALCEKNLERQFHHFRFLGDNVLEWLESGNYGIERNYCSELEKYRLYNQSEEFVIHESQLFNSFTQDVNIICTEPGMGKSTLMNNLKNCGSSEKLIIVVSAGNHRLHFRKYGANVEKFVEYFMVAFSKKDMGQIVFTTMVEQNQIELAWDGLDEASETTQVYIFELMKAFRKRGVRQWVTSRKHLKSHLETELRSFSRDIKPFKDNEQQQYIKDRLQIPEGEFAEMFGKVKDMFWSNYEILSIPLQIRLLTDLFLQNNEAYRHFLKGDFTLVHLYEYFVNEKFQIFYRDRKGISFLKDKTYQDFEDEKTTKINLYKSIAASSIIANSFTEEEDNALLFHNDKIHVNFVEKIKTLGDDVGIISAVSQNNVEFTHCSYRDYFTALYLFENDRSKAYDDRFASDSRYNNIRFFLNLMSKKSA